MIRVIIVEDERIIKSVTDKKDVLVAWAQENEKSPGYCVFNLKGEIHKVVDNDDVFELLIRSTLNCLDLRGVEVAFSKNKALFDALKRLGFKENGQKCEVLIKEFFKPCCK